MAFPATAAQKAALLGTHEMYATCTVLRGAQSLGDIPVIDCRITATYGTQGGRDGVLTVDRKVIDQGLLNPLSDQVIVRTGIPNLIDVPIFTGRVDTVDEASDGQVSVALESRGVEAIRAQFEIPWAAGPAGTAARAEIQRILTSIDPSWAVDISNANTSVIPGGLVWETDPGQALDQLAQGASLIWQPDRTGGFVVFNNPYSIGPILGANPVVTLTDGEDGVLVDVVNTKSRDGVWNSVTVIVERVDNTPPIRVTMRDTSVGSPTRWGGVFGRQNLVVKNQTPITQAETVSMAGRILRQSLALQRSFRITIPHMPLLDPGDVFVLWYRNVVYALVAESITYSYSADALTQITARELRTAEVTQVA